MTLASENANAVVIDEKNLHVAGVAMKSGGSKEFRTQAGDRDLRMRDGGSEIAKRQSCQTIPNSLAATSCAGWERRWPQAQRQRMSSRLPQRRWCKKSILLREISLPMCGT